MEKSVSNGCEVFGKGNIETTMAGRVWDIMEDIGDFLKNYGLEGLGFALPSEFEAGLQRRMLRSKRRCYMDTYIPVEFDPPFSGPAFNGYKVKGF